VVLAALLVQGDLTAPLILLGTEQTWLWLLVPALFVGFAGHLTAVVAATVIATSDAWLGGGELVKRISTPSAEKASRAGATLNGA
jgi:hypothetical protein